MATIDTNMSLVMIDPNEPLELYDGTIIKGRLEWFLYALCCLDYGNLPTPLSRIEEWANALITNELPNMEPQSRAEEFFKAILTGDTSNLPTPQSRSEVLLDKLARGENDFTNVEKIQSRYEFLLAYLIKNGGGIGNIDYVLYKFQKEDETLYNTKERPVKSAFLKGQTLVNLMGKIEYPWTGISDYSITYDDSYTSITVNNTGAWYQPTVKNTGLIKTSTSYLIVFDVIENTLSTDFFVIGNKSLGKFEPDNRCKIPKGQTGLFKFKLTSKSDFSPTDTSSKDLFLQFGKTESTGNKIKLRAMLIEYQEGMENWDIPYFEGMQSVKLPVLTTSNEDGTKTNILTTAGKNLFNMNRPYDAITDSQATVVQNTDQITVSSAESGTYVSANFILDKDFFAGKTVTGSCLYESDEKDIGTVQITYQDGNGDHHYQWIKTPRTFTFPNSFIGDVVLSVSANNTGTPQSNTVTVKNIQLELGSSATPYEPYSEVVLGGIGDVKDTLDLLTGENVIKTDEIVLDGTRVWSRSSRSDSWTTHSLFMCSTSGFIALSNTIVNVASNLLKSKSANEQWNGVEEDSISINIDGNLYVAIAKNKLTSDDANSFKVYLSQNNIRVRGVLKEQVIKTVDLTITDQGGATIPKLNTFDKITHVNVSATDILPGVEMEVATTIGEDLSGTLYSSMEDIETKQEVLKESNNAQTESVNSTMMATTEIYESLL